MERSKVKSKLEKVLRTSFQNDSLEASDDLTAKDVDGWDSLAHMALIVEIENAFHIKFKLKDLSKMHNIGCMIDIIMAKLRG
jgi:acyl carrier protein